MKKKIVELIRKNNSFLILSHINPDGDSIGSQLALAQALTQLGKTVGLVHPQPIPEMYMALPFSDKIEIKPQIDKQYQIIFFIECSSLDRAGFNKLPKAYYINVDHHLNNLAFADINWIDHHFSSTGEMIYLLLEELGAKITPNIAYNIYIAILTDTGSFQYANTTPSVFSICSKLARYGANPADAALKMYYSHPLKKIRLLTQCLCNLEIDDTGKIAWLFIPKERLIDEQGRLRDTEGFVNLPLSIKGIEVAMLIKELEDKKFRISLRSKGNVNVYQIAISFNGGGHRSAAGCYIEGDYQQVKKRMLKKIHSHFRKDKSKI